MSAARSRSWQDVWLDVFGSPPTDRTSREVSVQDVLTVLIAGKRLAWFKAERPTTTGSDFLRSMWRRGFGDAPEGDVEWFVSEYDLPVPPEWRDDIGLTYGCPDFACAVGDRVLIIELKTERRSYRRRQISDYLRLVRRKLPTAWTDVALLGPHRPNADPARDERQRYAEWTWHDIPDQLAEAFPDDDLAARLQTFLRDDLARPDAVEPAVTTAVGEVTKTDRVDAAVAHALRMAPSVAEARPGDQVERGIDVAFPSVETAREAQQAVYAALDREGLSERVSVWLWQPSSLGVPATPAGRDTGRELRLAPKVPKGQGG